MSKVTKNDDIHAIKQKFRDEASQLLSFRVLRMRMSQIDEIIRRKADRALVAMDCNSTGFCAPGKEAAERKRNEKVVLELLKKVKKRKKMTRSYTYLSWFSLFFVSFLGSLYLKEDNKHLNAVDFSIRNRIVDVLPSQGTIPSNAMFYEWLGGVVDDVFPSSLCGNGICEPPEEYPGFGRFGCVSDCGRFLQRTPIRIDVMPAWKSKPGGLDLPGFAIGSGDNANVNFSFNIYSETMQDYLFEADVTQSGGIVDVPDGNLWLELYQTESLFHDTPARDVADYAQIARTGALRPNKSFDFQYGDPAEAIATVAQINRQMHQYCTIDNDGSAAFASCPLNYDTVLLGSILRGRYGLAGKVSVSLGATTKTIVQFPYCNLSPARGGSIPNPALLDPQICSDTVLNKSAGEQSECFDGAVLSTSFSCPWRYPLSIWSFGPEKRNVSVRPASEISRVKTLTPFNNIVGGIILSQYRRKNADCLPKNQDAIGVLTGRYICQTADRGDGPFGIDPVFQKSSSLYNGKLSVKDYYSDNERIMGSDSNVSSYPFAFFPHHWQKGNFKESKYISQSNVGVHKLFLDSRISAKQAHILVQFMKDGMFISDKTEMVELEIITYNADFNTFGILTMQFTWDLGGGILWDVQYNTAQLSPYIGLKGQVTLALELIFGIMLAVDVVRESRDIYLAILQEKLVAGYISNFWNWIDWSHYGLLGTSLALWTVYNQQVILLNLKSSYPILEDIEAKARVFATDAQGEYEFLELTRKLRILAEMKNIYTALNCFCILFFIVRLLKILDFQPRMSLITRTLRVASTDLCHYTCLFAIVITGYASVGTFLLGDRLDKFQTFGASCRELFMISMGWDSVYRIMSSASKQTNVFSTSLVFLLFFWSWVLVATVLMLNMLLAIIIEAYTSVRSTMGDAPTIVHEAWIVCRESVHVVRTKFCAGNYLISDDELEEALLKQKKLFQSSVTVMDMIDKVKVATKSVRLAGGFEVSEKDVANILKESKTGRSLLSKSFKARDDSASVANTVCATEDGIEVCGNAEWNPPAAVKNLIERYGEIVFPGKDDAEFLELIQTENMKRQMAMHTTQDEIRHELGMAVDFVKALITHVLPVKEQEHVRTATLMKQNKHGSISLDVSDILPTDASISGKLKVTLVAAKYLPKLDIFTESDPYCVLLFEEHSSLDGEVSLDPVGRTEAKTNDANPIWNAEFVFPLKCSNSTRLRVAVLDKDENGGDDVIGYVSISISSLPLEQEVDKWYKLCNQSAPHLTKRALLRIKVLFCADEVGLFEAKKESISDQEISIEVAEAKLKDELQWLNARLSQIIPSNAGDMMQGQGPRILEVVLISARHLPRRDIFFMKVDPYVKLSFNGFEYSSLVRRRTYSPDWNQAFVFNWNGIAELKDGLKLALMDWDRFSHDDLIGFAEIGKETMRNILNQDSDWTQNHTLLIKRGKSLVIGNDGCPAEVTLRFSLKNPRESMKIINTETDNLHQVSCSEILFK